MDRRATSPEWPAGWHRPWRLTVELVGKYSLTVSIYLPIAACHDFFLQKLLMLPKRLLYMDLFEVWDARMNVSGPAARKGSLEGSLIGVAYPFFLPFLLILNVFLHPILKDGFQFYEPLLEAGRVVSTEVGLGSVEPPGSDDFIDLDAVHVFMHLCLRRILVIFFLVAEVVLNRLGSNCLVSACVQGRSDIGAGDLIVVVDEIQKALSLSTHMLAEIASQEIPLLVPLLIEEGLKTSEVRQPIEGRGIGDFRRPQCVGSVYNDAAPIDCDLEFKVRLAVLGGIIQSGPYGAFEPRLAPVPRCAAPNGLPRQLLHVQLPALP